MALAVQKNLEMAIIIILSNPYPKIHSLGKFLLLPCPLVSLVLDFTQMILAIQKHLEMAFIITLNNPEQP